MGSRTYSVLAFHFIITLWFSPRLIAGKDWEISPEDLKRSLERLLSESAFHKGQAFNDVADTLTCVQGSCFNDQKQLIIREVLIRNRLKLIDETCNTYNDEKLILEPPKAPPPSRLSSAQGSQFYKNYLDWQEKVLESRKIFCDPFKNLFCSSANKCACKPGSKWKIKSLQILDSPDMQIRDKTFKLDTCITPPGGACKFRSKKEEESIAAESPSPGYYDSLQQQGGALEPIQTPPCEALNMQDGCSSIHADYFMGPICLNEELDKKLPIFKKNLNGNSKVLGVGDTCDFDSHTQIYKSEAALDAEKFNVRLKALEGRQASGISLCDLRKFLTCGKSGKCECLEPARLEGTECTFLVADRTCGNNPAVKAMIMKNSFVPEAQRQLAQGIEKVSMDGCGQKSICFTDLQNTGQNDVEMFCICNGFFTGENCDQVLTLFLPFTRPSSLPSDVNDVVEKLKIFTEFNTQAVKFQVKLKLKSGEKCDFYKELEIRRLIRRIDSLNERTTVMTKVDYETLTKGISNFAQSGEQYCLRNLDPERRSLIEHSPYNQPIECEYSSRVCQTPLPSSSADQSQGQIILSHKKIIETFFSTLQCGEPCIANIDDDGANNAKSNIDRLENYLYDKKTFCVRPKDVGTKVNCETEGNGVNRKCTCQGANCTSVCSSSNKANATSHGVARVSRLAVNGCGGAILLLYMIMIRLTSFSLQ